MKLKPNSTSFSLSKKSVPSGERITDFSASKKLGKVQGGDRRAQQFKLENLKK